MNEAQVLQGRNVTAADIDCVVRLIKENPSFTRRRLSQEICHLWNWKNAQGQIKDMACRTLLLKLEGKKLLVLPARRHKPGARGARVHQPHSQEPIVSDLRDLHPNTRFLILPWVRVPHLASHVLSLIRKRIINDWMEKYNHPLWALETFVDTTRFKGTCYKAANWTYLGKTKGRSRNDRFHKIQTSIKDIYFYPLEPEFRKALV